MAGEQRTEQPTQRRLDRARREGNFPASREFISAIHFAGFVALAVTFSGSWIVRTGQLMRTLIEAAFSADLTASGLVTLIRNAAAPQVIPALAAGAALAALSVLAQLATTRMGLSLARLKPDFKRLSIARRIPSVFQQNLPAFLQALLLLPLLGFIVYREVSENLNSFLELPWLSAQTALARIGSTLELLLWRAAGLFLLAGVADLVFQRRRYMKQLRMTKQEIREEAKEMQGSPHVKARIRRLQRDLARRRMMQEIPNATAVIVNPTHFAVAIRYSMESAAAPRVVAKGKNYLAARIRRKAIEHQVPIVENAPLARALYGSVEVGQEIPHQLYRAVAEILAYIYKLMGGRMPG